MYFQPEYVSQFKCDGSKCNARCCKGWSIDIDEKSYEQYSHIEPPETAKEITSCIEFDSERKTHTMTLKPNCFCPMLTEKNLCRLQADYGEEFLSQTCTTYPRRTYAVGDFFERALLLSCPVAAEMILFVQEPLRFHFVEVSEKVHDNGGKMIINSACTNKFSADEVFEIQGAMLAILQERRLSINQRLIVLGFFCDKLEELLGIEASSKEELFRLINALKRTIASYNPNVFLRNGVPPVIQSIRFNPKKFVALMMTIFESIYVNALQQGDVSGKYLTAVIAVLNIAPNNNHHASVEEVAANYTALSDARKKFEELYSTFLENYLANEFFLNLYPWKFDASITKNFIVFAATYKVFELIIFSATLKGFDNKEELLSMVDWFTRKINHSDALQKKILDILKDDDDFLDLMEMLL